MDYKNFIYKNKPIIEMEKNISKESLINNFKENGDDEIVIVLLKPIILLFFNLNI